MNDIIKIIDASTKDGDNERKDEEKFVILYKIAKSKATDVKEAEANKLYEYLGGSKFILRLLRTPDEDENHLVAENNNIIDDSNTLSQAKAYKMLSFSILSIFTTFPVLAALLTDTIPYVFVYLDIGLKEIEHDNKEASQSIVIDCLRCISGFVHASRSDKVNGPNIRKILFEEFKLLNVLFKQLPQRNRDVYKMILSIIEQCSQVGVVFGEDQLNKLSDIFDKEISTGNFDVAIQFWRIQSTIILSQKSKVPKLVISIGFGSCVILTSSNVPPPLKKIALESVIILFNNIGPKWCFMLPEDRLKMLHTSKSETVSGKSSLFPLKDTVPMLLFQVITIDAIVLLTQSRYAFFEEALNIDVSGSSSAFSASDSVANDNKILLENLNLTLLIFEKLLDHMLKSKDDWANISDNTLALMNKQVNDAVTAIFDFLNNVVSKSNRHKEEKMHVMIQQVAKILATWIYNFFPSKEDKDGLSECAKSLSFLCGLSQECADFVIPVIAKDNRFELIKKEFLKDNANYILDKLCLIINKSIVKILSLGENISVFKKSQDEFITSAFIALDTTKIAQEIILGRESKGDKAMVLNVDVDIVVRLSKLCDQTYRSIRSNSALRSDEDLVLNLSLLVDVLGNLISLLMISNQGQIQSVHQNLKQCSKVFQEITKSDMIKESDYSGMDEVEELTIMLSSWFTQ